jgi:hypothetical protein
MSFNPPGEQKPTRFKLIIWLFIFLGILIFMFAILSQPLGIITGVLDDAYPTGSDFDTGRGQTQNTLPMLGLALGAAVVIGLIFLFIFYGFKNLGGGNKNEFG